MIIKKLKGVSINKLFFPTYWIEKKNLWSYWNVHIFSYAVI